MLDWSADAHDYQKRAAAHLASRNAATLWLSPGYGKTAAALHAFKALLDAGKARHMLVVAPLRVVQMVWAQEIDTWSSLKGLVAARLHGAKKEVTLKRRDVNVWVINYEGLPWLADKAKRGKLPFMPDVIAFDEIRRMKNAQGLRFKATRPLAAAAPYRWGLTGTPASNGLMDLFGQFLILDGGAALGTGITRFRTSYFEQHYDGFTWLPRPGAKAAIEERIADYVFRAEGKLDLPDFVLDPRTVVLDPKSRKIYTRMKHDLVAEIGGTPISAANAVVLVGKLKQMANGRVYDADRSVIQIHTAKKDALIELLDELGDEQLLIAYEYNHDLTQIREVLGNDVPYLGAGVNERTAQETVKQWNARKIQVLPAHPASAGHGLNLQKGGAHHILWWGPTFDLDHYIQFNDRLHRQGNTADAVIVHTFVAEDTVDEAAAKAREGKDTLQSALLSALTAEFGETIKVKHSQEDSMQLQFKSDQELVQAQQPAQQAPANPFAQAQKPAQQAPANPFAQAQQPAQQPQANPFAQAQQPQANPFDQQPTANPFAQRQAIQQAVSAPPPMTAQSAFAAFGVTAAAPAPEANPFAQPQGAPVAPENHQPPVQPVGWANPAPERDLADAPAVATGGGSGGDKPTIDVPSDAPSGTIPFYTFIPAGKLSAVLAAIGRAVK